METFHAGWAMLAVAVMAGGLKAQPVLSLGPPSAGQISLALKTKPGRMYRWESSANLQTWAGLPLAAASEVPLIAPGNSLNLTVPTGVPKEFFRVKEELYFDPSWADVKPLRIVPIQYDPTKSQAENGVALRTAMLALIPGDRLVIGPGTYSIASRTDLNLQGTAAAPIWIAAGETGGVIITRPDANQNLLNVGISDAGARYLAIQGIEMIGGSNGLRLGNCREIWIDRCHVHDTEDSAIVTGTQNSSRLFITRNEVNDTGGLGEGIALGMTGGAAITSESVIALNHVHHTNGPSVIQGDGIEIKQGSWGNLVSGNLVHDCNFPCIIVSRTGGEAVNIVENNVCYRGADNGMQIAGDSVVRNNLVIGGTTGAFFSGTVLSENPSRLTVVHNTFVATGRAVRLNAWSTGTGLVFANNACYSRDSEAVFVSGGAGSTVFAGLVTFGGATAGVPSAAIGTGLADFANLTWDGSARDAAPSANSPLRGAAANAQLTEYDLDFYLRTSPQATGSHR